MLEIIKRYRIWKFNKIYSEEKDSSKYATAFCELYSKFELPLMEYKDFEIIVCESTYPTIINIIRDMNLFSQVILEDETSDNFTPEFSTYKNVKGWDWISPPIDKVLTYEHTEIIGQFVKSFSKLMAVRNKVVLKLSEDSAHSSVRKLNAKLIPFVNNAKEISKLTHHLIVEKKHGTESKSLARIINTGRFKNK